MDARRKCVRCIEDSGQVGIFHVVYLPLNEVHLTPLSVCLSLSRNYIIFLMKSYQVYTEKNTQKRPVYPELFWRVLGALPSAAITGTRIFWGEGGEFRDAKKLTTFFSRRPQNTGLHCTKRFTTFPGGKCSQNISFSFFSKGRLCLSKEGGGAAACVMAQWNNGQSNSVYIYEKPLRFTRASLYGSFFFSNAMWSQRT